MVMFVARQCRSSENYNVEGGGGGEQEADECQRGRPIFPLDS